MPDSRTHRGANPKDEELFSHRNIIDIKAASADMCLLLTKGYSENAVLKLIGDHFNLTTRQRLAVLRASCSDRQRFIRERSHVRPHLISEQNIAIDGYNLLITIEATMAGGYIFIGHDGCYRDLASVHGTYRTVEETIPAIKLISKTLKELAAAEVSWYFDEPVSNSGKLKSLLMQFSEKNGLGWHIELAQNPDNILKESDDIVVSSDSGIIDSCTRWTNLAGYIIKNKITSNENIVDLN